MSHEQNLWPDVAIVDDSPIQILREQAEYLSQQTQGRLHGEVDVAPLGQQVRLTLSIVAPSLSGYRYRLLEVRHGVGGYPVTVVFFGDEFEAADAHCFVDTLSQVLSDERTVNVIQQLLSLTSG